MDWICSTSNKFIQKDGSKVSDVRNSPLPGDRVRFIVRAGIHEAEVIGVYQFKRRHSYVILDDGGGEWEVQSMWEMKKL